MTWAHRFVGVLLVGATALWASGCCCDALLFVPIDEVENPRAARQSALLRPNLKAESPRIKSARATRPHTSR